MFVTQAISYGLVFAQLKFTLLIFIQLKKTLFTSDFLIFKVDLFLGKIILRILFTRKIAKN